MSIYTDIDEALVGIESDPAASGKVALAKRKRQELAAPSGCLTSHQLAAQLGRSTVTLERWRRLRIGPPFFRICGRVVYDAAAVAAWIEEQKQATGRDGGVA